MLASFSPNRATFTPSTYAAPEVSIHALERYCQRIQGMEPRHIQYMLKHHRVDIESAIVALWKAASGALWRNAYYRQLSRMSGDIVLVFDWSTNKIVTVFKYDPERNGAAIESLPKAA